MELSVVLTNCSPWLPWNLKCQGLCFHRVKSCPLLCKCSYSNNSDPDDVTESRNKTLSQTSRTNDEGSTQEVKVNPSEHSPHSFSGLFHAWMLISMEDILHKCRSNVYMVWPELIQSQQSKSNHVDRIVTHIDLISVNLLHMFNVLAKLAIHLTSVDVILMMMHRRLGSCCMGYLWSTRAVFTGFTLVDLLDITTRVMAT